MKIDRAIEILNPEHREHYDGMDEVNEACRMGMEALERGRNAVPVVRCRDCKFYFPDSTKPCVLSIGLTMVDEDDFCSYGERNEDENGRT